MLHCFNIFSPNLLSALPVATQVHGFDPRAPSVIFVLALLVVLVVPMLFERFRVPGLIGLIIAGIALGPHAANWIPEDSMIPPLGSVGLLYLMFLVGLEIDMHRFMRERHNSVVFGLITFIIPQTLGTLGAALLLGFPWPAAILMASMFASHTLVPYPIVQRLGLVKQRVITAAAGGTVLTDTLALLVLAVIAESSRRDLTMGFWLEQGLKLVVYVGVVAWGAPRLSRWFFRRVGNVEGVSGFLYVLVFAFGCAAMAPLAGLEPIIGAFLAGLTLNLLIPDQSRLMIRLRFVGDALFIPFFLLSVGLRVDVALLMTSGKAWLVMLYMVAAGYVTKFMAALISGRILGFSRAETGVLFGLTVNQAAATLAAVIVGVRLGIFTDDVLNGTILMILATCLLGPWVTERYGRRLALQEWERSLDSSGAPERIMVPVSDERQIEPLMSLAMMIREPTSGEALYPTMIVPESDASEKDVANAEKLLANATLQAVEGDAPVSSIVRLSDNMVEEIIGASRDLRISTLVVDDQLSFPSEFEHVPTRLVEQGRHLVFRFFHPTLLNTCRRVQVAIPPLMERQAGFAAAWAVLRRLVGQIGANMQILADKSTMQSMIRRKHFQPDDPQIETVALPNWSRAVGTMRKKDQQLDLRVLFLARTGQLSWEPGHARMPGLVSRMMPGQPCLAIYPSELKWEKEPVFKADDPAARFQSMFPPEQVFLNLTQPTLSRAVEHMVMRTYPGSANSAARKKLLADLAAMAREAPLRIAPECVLLHSHQATPPAPMALLATRQDGFAENGGEQTQATPPRLLLVLLGVPEESSEEHLRRLAAIASMFRVEGWIDNVIGAQSYEELLA